MRNTQRRGVSDIGQKPAAGGGLGSMLVTGLLLGFGIAGFVDEAVFHQLLQWHTFYWGTTEHGRILSDGLFHVVSTLGLLWGTFRLWRDRASSASIRSRTILGGILMGAGGFNLYDGIVQHVILHLHLVNEHVCPTPNANNSLATCPQDIPFEIVWIAIALAVLLAGIVWWRRVVRQDATQAGS